MVIQFRLGAYWTLHVQALPGQVARMVTVTGVMTCTDAIWVQSVTDDKNETSSTGRVGPLTVCERHAMSQRWTLDANVWSVLTVGVTRRVEPLEAQATVYRLVGVCRRMRLALFVAAVIVAWAATISITGNAQTLHTTQLIAPTILALGNAVQRINGVQRWLSAPKKDRRLAVQDMAQEVLLSLCQGKPLTEPLCELRVHVWEVPVWYRRIFPNKFRGGLKWLVKRNGFHFISLMTISPTLRRVAAVGLYRPVPSGVRFSKGVGLIGVCIAANDPTEILSLDATRGSYKRALKARTEEQWESNGEELTHSLSRADAVKLSHSYGQVIAKVIQDVNSGEAIGCVTIGVHEPLVDGFDLSHDEVFRRSLRQLARTIAPELSLKGPRQT